jgi:hypothetical protein
MNINEFAQSRIFCSAPKKDSVVLSSMAEQLRACHQLHPGSFSMEAIIGSALKFRFSEYVTITPVRGDFRWLANAS